MKANKREGVIINCLYCQSKIYVAPSRRETAKFCSRKCYAEHQKIRTLSEATKNKISESMKGRLPKNAFKLGHKTSEKIKIKISKAQYKDKSHNWKGGKTKTSNGYNNIYQKSGVYKLEHRIVAEKVYGKFPDEMVVHHIDGDKLNNVPNNLLICSRSEHSKIHNFGVN